MSVLLQKLLRYEPTLAPVAPRPLDKALWKRVVLRSGESVHAVIASNRFTAAEGDVFAEFEDLLNEFVYTVLEHESEFEFGLEPKLLFFIDASHSTRLKLLRGSELTHKLHELLKDRLPHFLQAAVFIVLPALPPVSIYFVWQDTISTPRLHFVFDPRCHSVDSDVFIIQCYEIAKAANPDWPDPLSPFTQIIDRAPLLDPQPPPSNYGRCPVVLENLKTLIIGLWKNPEHTQLILPDGDTWRAFNEADTTQILTIGRIPDREDCFHQGAPPIAASQLKEQPADTASLVISSADSSEISAVEEVEELSDSRLAVYNSECEGVSIEPSDSWSTLSSAQCGNTCVNCPVGTPLSSRKASACKSNSSLPTPVPVHTGRTSPSEDSILSERIVVGNLRIPRFHELLSHDELAELSVCDIVSEEDGDFVAAGGISERSSVGGANVKCCLPWRKNYCSAR